MGSGLSDREKEILQALKMAVQRLEQDGLLGQTGYSMPLIRDTVRECLTVIKKHDQNFDDTQIQESLSHNGNLYPDEVFGSQELPGPS